MTKTVLADCETGEPEHIKIYIRDLCKIKGLKDADYRTLLRLIKCVNKKWRIQLTERTIDEICEALKINRDTLRKRLPRLTKSNLLKKCGRNDYMVNPYYFSTGSMSWKEVCENNIVFRIEINYNCNKKRDLCREEVSIRKIPDLKIVK